jgi:SHS2 domain-containing protein
MRGSRKRENAGMTSAEPTGRSLAARSVGYFDHDADIGIIGRGATAEAAMEQAAAALFGIVVDIASVRPLKRLEFTFEESDVEFALVTWLNRLLAESRSEGLVPGSFRLGRTGSTWRGECWGEPWRPGLERGVEVKGATLTMLAIEHLGGGWEARCVVDV